MANALVLTLSGRRYADPTAAELRRELRTLAGKAAAFAVLERSDGSFVQTSRGAGNGFVLEHRSPTEGLRRARHSGLSLRTVERAFVAFAAAEADPLYGLRVGSGSAPRRARRSPLAFVAGLAIGVSVCALLVGPEGLDVVPDGPIAWRIQGVALAVAAAAAAGDALLLGDFPIGYETAVRDRDPLYWYAVLGCVFLVAFGLWLAAGNGMAS